MGHKTTLLLCASWLAGCGSVVRPSPLRPPPNPVLESSGDAPLLRSLDDLDGTDADPDLALGRRALVARALAALEGQARIGDAPASDLGLVRAAFAEARLDAGPGAFEHASGLRDHSRRRHGAPRPADLVFFEGDGFGPRVGVVTRVLRGGAVEALFVTRGAVRRIRFDLRRPGHRRADGAVVNTFIRPKRRDDPRGTAHLAGQLVESVRTLLD